MADQSQVIPCRNYSHGRPAIPNSSLNQNVPYFSVSPLHLLPKGSSLQHLRENTSAKGSSRLWLGFGGFAGFGLQSRKKGKEMSVLSMLAQPGCARGAQTLWNGCWQQEEQEGYFGGRQWDQIASTPETTADLSEEAKSVCSSGFLYFFFKKSLCISVFHSCLQPPGIPRNTNEILTGAWEENSMAPTSGREKDG